MNGRVGLIVVVVAVLLTGAGPIGAAAGATNADQSQSSPFAVQQDQIDADEVRMDIALEPNGTAEWTLEFWIRLDDNESVTAFESLRDDIRDNPENRTQSFADRMDETVATASEATGRDMSVDGFSVTTARQSLAREYGVVRYTFRWHEFAAVEGDELRAGDAIEGIYLDDGTRLLLEWPDGYERASVTPGPDDERENAVIWRGGETDFVSGEPRVVVTAAGSEAGASTAVIAGVAIVLTVGVWWYRNRTKGAGQTAGGDGTPAPDSGPGPSSNPSPSSASGTTSAVTTGTSATSATGTPDTALLTNEEQVLRLITDRGGRMKQQAVVEELDWTDAKTSKVVSALREEGKLESFRLGRENVLSLPDADDGIATDLGGDGTE